MNLWGRLGISVAIVAMFCIVMTEFLQSTAYYESYRWHMCGLFVAAGISLGLIGRRLNERWRKAQQLLAKRDEFSDQSEDEAVPTDPFLLVNVAYWGLMLIVMGITIVFIIPRAKEPVVVQAAVAPPAKRPNPTNAVPAAPAPVQQAVPQKTFPPISLHGISYRKNNPSALINGKTFFVGDHVGAAKLIAIDAISVTFEMDGEYKVFVLGK